MSVRIGINGFGRIGRSIFRILSRHQNLETVAVNDLYDNEQLAYLLRFDTVMGAFEDAVEVTRDDLVVGGRRIAMTAERDPARIPWRELGVQVVVESTGAFRRFDELQAHREAGAERVVLTVPPKDESVPMVVLGANDEEFDRAAPIVSNASCTTNCLAPLARVLDDRFGLVEGFLTTVHAYTNSQRLADVPQKDLRRSRAAAENIIPTTTGAARAVGRVLPWLDGRLDGLAIRVPVPDGSIVDFVCRVDAEVGVGEVNEAVREAAEGRLRGIVEYATAPLVSSDVIGNPHSAIFDSLMTDADGSGRVRVVAWYDNEWGYSNRVVDLIDLLVGPAG